MQTVMVYSDEGAALGSYDVLVVTMTDVPFARAVVVYALVPIVCIVAECTDVITRV